MRPFPFTAVLLVALVGTACSVQQTTSPSAPIAAPQSGAFGSVGAAVTASSSDLSDVINRFAADNSSFNNFYSLRWSEKGLERREAFLVAALDDLKKMDIDGVGGSTTARVDAVLLRNDIRGDLSRVRLAKRQLAEMNALLPIRDIVAGLDDGLSKGTPLDAKAAAAQLATIPDLIKKARETADAAKPSAVTAQRAAAALNSLKSTLREWYEFHSGFEPDFGWWCSTPYNAANSAIDEFSKHLRESVAGIKGKPEDPLIGDPIGREALLDELKNEVIAYSPEELIAIADAEMAWCTQQAIAAAKEMGIVDAKGNGDWKAALAKVKDDVPPPGGQVPYVLGIAHEAIDFVKTKGDNGGPLVTVPPMCEELWKAQMLSPHEQRTLPFAVYFQQAIGIAAPTDSMSHDDKLMAMRGNNRRFTRIVVPHELIPGHHLQSFMAQREKPYRRRFSTPFYVEGWALYWEMKLWDLNWAKSPEDRLGMLFWRMHRCARITVSLKFHLGQMSPEQMIDFLITNVGHEKANATAEVRRYIGPDYGPLYQAGYMIGGLQLRALHKELVPSKMTELQFNDAVLKQGPVPIELIRAELTGEWGGKLDVNGEAAWKFAPH